MSCPTADSQAHRFNALYARDDRAYGSEPAPELMRHVRRCIRGGRALDLGAGLGRHTLALAQRGLHVTAIDVSDLGIAKLREAARRSHLAPLIDARVADLRALDYPPRRYSVIVAATVLDHIPRADVDEVLPRLAEALHGRGVAYIEVHTTEDPGSPVGPGRRAAAPVSETADAIRHYFAPNELLRLAAAHLRVIHYEERREWDRTHGRPHQHGKAVALAVRPGTNPPLYGPPQVAP